MTNKEYKKEVALLKTWADAYYKNNAPIATDEEYDSLARKCLEYEKANPKKADPKSPNKVVNESFETHPKRPHPNAMLSQKDIFNEEELLNWLTKLGSYKEIEFVTELKFDGASLNLIYTEGKLIEAISRGDGKVGSSIMGIVDVIEGISKTIPSKDFIEVRGEVVIRKLDFEKINEEKEKNGEVLFANARNAAAGSMRLLDIEEASKRKMVFYPWEVKTSAVNKTHIENLLSINGSGKKNFLDSPFRKVVKGIDQIMDAYRETLKNRNDYPVLIDGLIIKINDTLLRNALGVVGKYPRGSCAFKYPAVEKITTIVGVTGQIGRTGVYTPVAYIEPVPIDGSLVKKVTLNNYDYIKTNDIKIGDQVSVIKSGDIIPKIISVYHNRRDGSEVEIKREEKCACGELLVHDEITSKCVSDNCNPRLISQLSYFTDRECMDIRHMGGKTIELLVDSGALKNFKDIYELSFADMKRAGVGEKTIYKIFTSIANSKGKSISTLIKSLGIPLIGGRASTAITNKVGMDIFNIEDKTLEEIEGFGSNTAKSFNDYMSKNIDMVKMLMWHVKPTWTKVEASDKYIMVTGSLKDGDTIVTRDMAKAILTNMGYGVEKSVGKKLDFLLVGEKAGIAKITKANKINVPIVDVSKIDFNKMNLDKILLKKD